MQSEADFKMSAEQAPAFSRERQESDSKEGDHQPATKFRRTDSANSNNRVAVAQPAPASPPLSSSSTSLGASSASLPPAALPSDSHRKRPRSHTPHTVQQPTRRVFVLSGPASNTQGTWKAHSQSWTSQQIKDLVQHKIGHTDISPTRLTRVFLKLRKCLHANSSKKSELLDLLLDRLHYYHNVIQSIRHKVLSMGKEKSKDKSMTFNKFVGTSFPPPMISPRSVATAMPPPPPPAHSSAMSSSALSSSVSAPVASPSLSTPSPSADSSLTPVPIPPALSFPSSSAMSSSSSAPVVARPAITPDATVNGMFGARPVGAAAARGCTGLGSSSSSSSSASICPRKLADARFCVLRRVLGLQTVDKIDILFAGMDRLTQYEERMKFLERKLRSHFSHRGEQALAAIPPAGGWASVPADEDSKMLPSASSSSSAPSAPSTSAPSLPSTSLGAQAITDGACLLRAACKGLCNKLGGQQRNIGLALATLDGRFLECNERFFHLTGYSADYLANNHVGLFTLIHPGNLAATFQLVNNLLDGTISEWAGTETMLIPARSAGAGAQPVLSSATLSPDPASASASASASAPASASSLRKVDMTVTLSVVDALHSKLFLLRVQPAQSSASKDVDTSASTSTSSSSSSSSSSSCS